MIAWMLVRARSRTLFELPVEERVQPVPAGTEGIDLAHGREYPKPPVSEIGAPGCAATVELYARRDMTRSCESSAVARGRSS